MSKLLVIGSGLLGREVAFAARDRFQTVSTYNNHPVEIDGCNSRQMDITGSLDLIQFISPDYIVLTAAMTNVDGCEADRIAAWKANALGPKNVALAARDIGAKLIYVSTDYVFDGERGMYREDDQTMPINYYGESKLAGERFVREICPDSVIARASVLYGQNPIRQNFVTWAADEMKKGNKINIVNDQYTSPTLSSNLADMILSIRDLTGVFHTCGSERINRYDFSIMIARAFCLDESLVNPITSNQLSWKARRPMDSSLDISKVSRFAKPLNVKEGLKAMVDGNGGGMKGLVLSGGFGTRLRPLTYSQQKQLIPVANKPILFYAIEDIIAAGVHDIGIIVGPNRDQVEKTVKSRYWDANIEFIYQDAPRGLAHTVLISEKFIGNEPFVMYLGDNLLCDGIADHADRFRSSGADASILLTEVSHPERFGVAELNERGEVVRLVEKPKVPPSNLALVGVYLFKPIIFDAVKNITPSWRNELEITDAIQWLVEKGYQVKASVVKGWWKDTGMPEDILSANNLILDEIEASNLGVVMDGSVVQGRVQIGQGTILENGSVVRGPVIIGRECKISNSYIGPYTSIGERCEILDSEIEGSIVMDGTRIDVQRKIVDSLIGANVRISESSKKPHGYRFIIGDSSEVKV